jgi:neopullulanase
MLRPILTSVALLAMAPLAGAQSVATPGAPSSDYRARTPDQEVVYFVLPDRFENGDTSNDTGRSDKAGRKAGRLVTGFDPTARGFYHGGDLKGLTRRLDYIQGLGATAIWVGPVFRNKPVQGPAGDESAGYHGYWITDFTHVDPHFGSDDDFRALVDAAHARGMKVYMDIIVNHTADVIQYREVAPQGGYPYHTLGGYPFSRRGGVKGAAINPGFAGDADPSAANWAKMTDPTFAYTPYVPKGEETVKVPAWLNDPIWYHNRGNTAWKGESAQYGDFSGLDDLATENPRVIRGFIDIYGDWIDRFGIDGFRIDTAKHVNPEFWRAFVPAILDRAKARGIPNFHIFGEVATSEFDPALLAGWTRNAGLPSVLDFGFAVGAIDAVTGKQGTQELARMLDADVLYAGEEAGARQLPTFVSNHDAGRVAMFIRSALPKASDEEVLARVKLAHAMLLTMRGVPVVYYGDEQGFAGLGGDQSARQDMFASQVAEYNHQSLLGTKATTAQSNFDPAHPLYSLIADLARVRRETPALNAGSSKVRQSLDKPGLFVVSRFDPADGREVVLAFNTSPDPVAQTIPVDPASMTFAALAGTCPATATAPGSLALELPAFGFAVCSAGEKGKAQP